MSRRPVSRTLCALLLLSSLGGCAGAPETKPVVNRPDYRIKIMQTSQGLVAVPPECPSWNLLNDLPNDNNMPPSFGCASARNLAAMIDRPSDLIKGRAAEPAVGVSAASSIDRYYAEKTIPLADPYSKKAEAQNVQSTGGTAANPTQ